MEEPSWAGEDACKLPTCRDAGKIEDYHSVCRSDPRQYAFEVGENSYTEHRVDATLAKPALKPRQPGIENDNREALPDATRPELPPVIRAWPG